LAYNLEAVAEVMGNEIFIKTALSKYTYRIYEVKGECWPSRRSPRSWCRPAH
jgi:hypothetical protein